VLFTPMDHHATLAAVANAKAPSGMDGHDLSAALAGATPAADRDAVLIANYSSHWDYFHSEWPWPEWRGVRTRRHTYVKWLSGTEELFDNAVDPYQMQNLAASDATSLKQMRERLHALLAEANDDFMAGPAYSTWFDAERNIVRTGRGPAGEGR
jgi:hypothetical protein